MRPTAGGPGVLKLMWGPKLAPNGPCLRRCPRPTGPRAMWVERCAAAARNPEPSNYQVNRTKSKPIHRAMRGQVVRCCTGLYFLLRAFAINRLCRALFIRSCDLYVMPLGATFLPALPLSALTKLIQEVAFQIISKLCTIIVRFKKYYLQKHQNPKGKYCT